jgi:hypothetical protein
MKLPNKARMNEVLRTIEKRKGTLNALCDAVVKGYSPAMFVYGDPGLGKSHLLTNFLCVNCGNNWKHHTAYTTPKGLVQELYANREAIHLFEDMEGMFKQEQTASILRAACGAPNDRERWVTWTTNNEKIEFTFRGGIIIATNANLAKGSGPLQGVASRFRPVRWDMSIEERICTILKIADQVQVKNGVVISKQESKHVAVTLCDMVLDHRLEVALDIRLFAEHALPAFAQCKVTPGLDWIELLVAKLTGVAQTSEETRDAKTRRLETLAGLIDSEGGPQKQKLEKWKSQTGLNKAMYYRHLKNSKRPTITITPPTVESETMKFLKEAQS